MMILGGDDMIRLFFGILIIGIIAVYYSFRTAGGYKWVSGSGKLVTVQESVDQFDRVDVHNGFTLDVVKGSTHELTIDIDDNLVEYLEIFTEDGCLNIGMKPDMIIKSATMKARVSTENLSFLKGSGATIIRIGDGVTDPESYGMKLSGASEVKGKLESRKVTLNNSGASNSRVEITGDEVEVTLTGASDFKVSGSARSTKLNASGASSIRAGKFRSEQAEIRLSGASSVKMYVDEVVSVNASGGSDVVLLGQPRIQRQNIGAASSIRLV